MTLKSPLTPIGGIGSERGTTWGAIGNVKLKAASIASVLLVGTCALAAGLLGRRDRPVGGDGRCAAPDARVVVDLAKHTLALCDKGSLVEKFDVRLGKGGVGKTREGDGKTPVGTYALGVPRPSNRFGTFIPIGYPTDEQRSGATRGAMSACTDLRAGSSGSAAW